MSGTFLANGFLVGCYANVDDFPVAHLALAPLRSWYWTKFRVFGAKHDESKEGIHRYAKKLMKIQKFLPKSIQKKMLNLN